MRTGLNGLLGVVGALFLLISCLADPSRAQIPNGNGGSAGVPDLCGTSNTQSLASSGFGGNPPTRFESLRCDTVANAYVVSIFNGAESIVCSNLPDITTAALTFSVDMTCTGPENGGRGITGSLSIPLNESLSTDTSAVILPYGITAQELLVVPSTSGITLSGRTCTLNLRADLYARRPGSSECVSCLNAIVLTVKDTCGFENQESSCNFFNVVCRFTDGTWENSAIFWIYFIIVMWAAMIFGYLLYVIAVYQSHTSNAVRVNRKELDMTSGDGERLDELSMEKKVVLDKYPEARGHLRTSSRPTRAGGGRFDAASSSSSAMMRKTTEPIPRVVRSAPRRAAASTSAAASSSSAAAVPTPPAVSALASDADRDAFVSESRSAEFLTDQIMGESKPARTGSAYKNYGIDGLVS